MSTEPKKSIHISFEGNTTRATLLTDYHGDTRTKTAFAKYNPDDAKAGRPYSEYEGARIAICRLFGVEPFPKDPEPQFNVGDLVEVKINSAARGLDKNSVAKVEWKSPNKMTPYLVKVLDTPHDPKNFSYIRPYPEPHNSVIFAGEMKLLREAKK